MISRLLLILSVPFANAFAQTAPYVPPALPVIPTHTVSVTDFGAVSDDATDNTAAFTKAIAAIKKAGGGHLNVPSGTYHVGALTLTGRLDLHLERDARLLFSNDPETYRIGDRKFRPLILASEADDLSITGEGVLDGQGTPWWVAERAYKTAARAKGAANEEVGRPRLLIIEKSKRVLIEGITLTNSPQFHFIPSRCEDLTVRNVTVHSPKDAPNTDGIDPAACRHVLISGCDIDTGDDNIAIKSGNPGFGPVDNILIENCTFLHGHGMSIGSETYGGVRNVTVRHCTFDSTQAGIRMKSSRGRGGLVENISYEDLTMRHVVTAIEITSYYPNNTTPKPGHPDTGPAERDPRTPAWHDIAIRNVHATDCKSAGIIIGLPEEPVAGIHFENVSIEASTGLRIAYARTLIAKAFTITTTKGPAFSIEPTADPLSIQP